MDFIKCELVCSLTEPQKLAVSSQKKVALNNLNYLQLNEGHLFYFFIYFKKADGLLLSPCRGGSKA